MRQIITDSAGRVVRRVVATSDGWTITQVPQPDGTWWNLFVERTRKA